MPPNDIHELYVELRVQAPAECPSCGVNDWLDTPEVPVVLPHVDLSGPKPVSMSRTEALFMICGACGFIWLHSAKALRMLR